MAGATVRRAVATIPFLAVRTFRRGMHGAWRFAGHRIHAPRIPATILLIGFGLLLLLASAAIGVAWLSFPASTCWWFDPTITLERMMTCRPSREVGFWGAPNWALTSVVLWPAMFYVLRSLLDHAELVFAGLDRSPMTWLSPGTQGETIASTWARHKRYLRRIAVGALAFALLFSIVEWWTMSGNPLLGSVAPPEGELDWSSVPAGEGRWSNWAQASFSLAAFLYQGIAIALMAIFAAATILMARTMGLHGSGQERPALLIDIESNDPAKRVGFERFVIVIDYMIVFVALTFLNFFLTRIQNAYLRDADYGSLGEFIRQDFLVRQVEDIPQLLDAGTIDFSSAAVSIGAVLLMFQCFFFFNATLRHAALQARNRSDHELVRGPLLRRAQGSGLDRAEIRTRLRDANVWPLGYSDLMPTLSFLTICVVTIIFYKIGIYFVFLWIAGWIVARSASGLLRRS